MVRIKEIKISIHRKYTKDFQSYGYRIGLQLEVGQTDGARSGYYEGKAFLNERIAEEDLIIKNIMDKKDAERSSGYKVLDVVPEKKMILSAEEVSAVKSSSEGNELIPFVVKRIVSVTDKAVLVELYEGKNAIWIPKSCVKEGGIVDKLDKDVEIMLTIKRWFLKKMGLVQ